MEIGDDDEPKYEVGFGKPPIHSRFRSGQSGNPAGRKPGSRGIRSDLGVELDAPHRIQLNGKEVKDTRQQLMLMTLAARAATGDLKAAALLIPLILQVFGPEDRGKGRAKLSGHDEALLREFLGEAAGGSGSDASIEDSDGGGNDNA